MDCVEGSEASGSASLWKPSVPSSFVATTIQRAIKVDDGKWRANREVDGGVVDKALRAQPRVGTWEANKREAGSQSGSPATRALRLGSRRSASLLASCELRQE
jgi:hypothetical protein